MILLYIIGIVAGMVVPFQTSINSRLSLYTKSSFYASTISFATGTIFLILINLIINPDVFTGQFYSNQSLNYQWFVGGMLGVIFLTGNLLLLPRLGASLTVVMTVAGQIIMGVAIDSFGWFGADKQPFTLLKVLGILFLIFGILLMNYVRRNPKDKIQSSTVYIWLIIGFMFGFCPPIQTAINSALGQQLHSSIMASLISFTVGTIVLFILTLIFNKSLKVTTFNSKEGKLKPIYFIGGILGVIFVTTNIILMPHLGAALTTIIVMLGQMLMGVIIDHFGLLGTNVNKITPRKVLGIIAIMIGIILLRLF
ncbi:DMT family transporter [Staphylococcus shinii]|uniref:DMT family transporter n=1 Tax=Staphylococcus shinii TaxID=2912228 RepID=UPI00298EF47F|nr:DMT family transporter [Staphylococcus shinii]MDW8570305.1 DMT family transporter [Staphylococcus shinii]MDW8573788.1 DMT family transporter [Staphylococcus shinii]